LLILVFMVAVLTVVAQTHPALSAEHARTWYGKRVWADGTVTYTTCTAGRCTASSEADYEAAQRQFIAGSTTVGLVYTESAGYRGGPFYDHWSAAYARRDDGELYVSYRTW